jgi:DNA helicase-2/ATP-dependent DNA helicase PcrA
VLKGRDLPVPAFQIGTLHSHAYKQLGKAMVAETKIDDWNKHRPDLRLSGVARSADDPDWEASPQETVGDIACNRYHLLRHAMTERKVWPESVKFFAKAWEAWKAERGYIDFTDMISDGLAHIPAAPGNPKVVIADECQDLSALEVALLKKWGSAAGALMCAGDPWQSLYIWRGADPASIFDSKDISDHKIVLRQSWRLSRAVHGLATSWIRGLSDYSQIEYKPRDEDGYVESTPASWTRPEIAIRKAEELVASGKSVMFATTCSYMLPPIVRVLRDRGLPFANPWRTKRGDWNPLGARRGKSTKDRILDFLRPDPATWSGADTHRLWTRAEVASWIELLKTDKVLIRGTKRYLDLMDEDHLAQEATLSDLEDWIQADHLQPLLDAVFGAENGKPGQLISWLESRLDGAALRKAEYPLTVARMRYGATLRDGARLYVGTIHSFKGAEADHVFLFPDLSPAGMREWSAGGEVSDSVIRTFYVGITRAKVAVHLCEPANHGMSVDLKRYT